MTNKPAREWWIDESHMNDDYSCVSSDPVRNCIHVIEKSYADDLKAQLTEQMRMFADKSIEVTELKAERDELRAELKAKVSLDVVFVADNYQSEIDGLKQQLTLCEAALEKIDNFGASGLTSDEAYEAQEIAEQALQELRGTNKCPPHDWTKDGERCSKCGIKDWMT